MAIRVGRVTNVYPAEGRLQIAYEDTGNTSMPIPMLSMNNEYSMPAVGDRVVTLHMENGESKGFVLGTYYGGGMQPNANSGYRKDFDGSAYVICNGGIYKLYATEIDLSSVSSELILSSQTELNTPKLSIDAEATELNTPKLSIDTEATELNSTDVGVSCQSASLETDSIELSGTSFSAEFEDTNIEGSTVSISGDDFTLACSYGTVTLEDIIKRIERIEDELGLPHTI